ncbi:AEC family transporter [Streptomyces sp. HNM0574]|uniref:AEC family transporter n=1 Tax=Streptomyces sp. HNM0574 TaxID=2714954 RepID=UPI00146EA5E5|nr:AEC family transporter [Streptomyces sp. HNM0574]NLU69448.1 AEC family transporter [Streptomyces sp. HNM0574]
MSGILTGFSTIGAIIVLGVVLGHFGVLDVQAQRLLSRLAFYVANPALMVTVLGDTDISAVLSAGLPASLGGVAVAAGAQVAVSRYLWRSSAAESTIGAFCAAYANAGNLGLPIAGYVLGDASLVAPMLLTQLLVLQPAGLTVLDLTTGDGPRTWRRVVATPFTNPLLIGSLVGVALSLLDLRLPAPLRDPLDLVGGMAIPAMLLAYGLSLRFGPLPGRGARLGRTGFTVFLKLVVQPVVTFLLARYALGLDGAGVLAVTVIAALPTAQNVFVHASRYGVAEVPTRDCVFLTTILSAPVLFAVATLLA